MFPNHHLSTGRPLSGVSLGGVLSVSTDTVMIESSDLEPRFISLKRVNHAQEIWLGHSSERGIHGCGTLGEGWVFTRRVSREARALRG